MPQIAKDMDTHTYRFPLGVTAGITPFNFPAMIPLWVCTGSYSLGVKGYIGCGDELNWFNFKQFSEAVSYQYWNPLVWFMLSLIYILTVPYA